MLYLLRSLLDLCNGEESDSEYKERNTSSNHERVKTDYEEYCGSVRVDRSFHILTRKTTHGIANVGHPGRW